MNKTSLFLSIFMVFFVEASAGKKLIVGTKEAPPFVMKDLNGEFTGIAIDLWETAAKELDFKYEYVEYDLQDLLDAAKKGEIDVAVAPLTLTSERETDFDFSHPFHVTGLSIAVRTEGGNAVVSLLDAIFSRQFLTVVGSLTVILLFIGLIIWFFERKHNRDQFGEGASKGIFASFWWAAVTMTTVGYGDKAPKTVGGRIIGLIWMFAALIIVSSITAALTTALTLEQLHTKISAIHDLHRVKVAAVKNSSTEDFLREKAIRYRSYDTIESAIEALRFEKVDAVIHDEPIMKYSIKTLGFSDEIKVLPIVLKLQYYGFGLKENVDFREDLNRKILEVINTLEWNDNLDDYLEE